MTEPGDVFCVGQRQYGQLGLNARENKLHLQPLSGCELIGARMVTVATWTDHSAGVTADGKTHGYGPDCQLSHNDVQARMRSMIMTLSYVV